MRFVRCNTTSCYEAMILTPYRAFDVLMKFESPAYAYVVGGRNGLSHSTNALVCSGASIRLRELPDSRAPHLDLWADRIAEEPIVARSGTFAFVAGRIHAGLEKHNALRAARRLGVCVIPVQG